MKPNPSDLLPLMRVHPLWLSRRKDWLTIQALRTKRTDFRSFIPRGPIEDEQDFELRCRMTRFVPEAMAARNRAVGAVFSAQPDRSELPRAVQEWSASVDRAGRSFHHWLEVRAVPLMFDFGACHVLVDLPRRPEGAQISSRADEEKLGLSRPFLVAYDPLAVRNWQMNDRGELEWIVIVEDSWITRDDGSRVPSREYRLFNREEWHFWASQPAGGGKPELREPSWDANGEPDERSRKAEALVPGSYATGKHGSPGVVPVASMLTDPDVEIIGRSLIESAVELDLRRLLLESDQTFDLWLHAHPLMWVKSSSTPSEMQLGSSKWIHLNPEAGEDVGYAAPPTESFQARERAIRQALRDTYRHTGVDPIGALTEEGQGGGGQASGVARAFSFKTSEARHIVRLRNRVEEGENLISAIVARFLGAPLEKAAPVSWPDDFDEEDRTEAIENAILARPLVNLSPTAERILLKRATLRALGDVSSAQRAQIEREIDGISDEELAQARRPFSFFESPGAGGEEGEPSIPSPPSG